MARNEEKQLGRLNRFLLQQQKEDALKKNPPRPRLESLNTAKDIKKWLPSIIKDLDFNLAQSQVHCYTESKVSEHKEEINRLEKLYKAFVRKLKQLDPNCDAVPWTDRPYTARKRTHDTEKHSADTKKAKENNYGTASSVGVTIPDWLALPLLDGETETEYVRNSEDKAETVWNCSVELQDKPLQFVDTNTDNAKDSATTKSDSNPLSLDYDTSSSEDG